MLASPLAVSLAGDHGGAAAVASDMAGGEHDIDDRQTVFDAFRLVLEPARVQSNGAFGFCDPVGGLLDVFRRDACYGCDALRVPGRHRFLYGVETCRVLGNELLVFQT